MWIRILTLFIIFFSMAQAYGQDQSEFKLFENLYQPVKPEKEYLQLTKNNSNELQWIASGLLIFYKSFFSSQDGNRCVFHPSCSVYAIESIKRKGFFIGFADAMDRLSRCNRLSPENYIPFENTDLFFDPVR